MLKSAQRKPFANSCLPQIFTSLKINPQEFPWKKRSGSSFSTKRQSFSSTVTFEASQRGTFLWSFSGAFCCRSFRQKKVGDRPVTKGRERESNQQSLRKDCGPCTWGAWLAVSSVYCFVTSGIVPCGEKTHDHRGSVENMFNSYLATQACCLEMSKNWRFALGFSFFSGLFKGKKVYTSAWVNSLFLLF